MSLTSTTLAAAITATQLEFKVTSSTGFAVGDVLRIDSEDCGVKAVDTTTHWIRVERGINGTLASAHRILALAVVGLPEDFNPPVPSHMYTYGANGAITVGPGLHRLACADVGAYTLRAPQADEEGVLLTLVSTTAKAHVLTLDSGTFNGGADSQIVFAGAIGNAVDLLALGGSWIIASADQGTAFNVPSKSQSVSPSKSQSSSPSVSPSASA